MPANVKYHSLENITYQSGWDLQTKLHNQLKSNKLSWRDLPEEEKSKKQQIHHLLFCQHNHVYTLGKSGSQDHLLLDDAGLSSADIEYFKINRGGDITYHGPGQITGYPIFDLDEFFTDVHKYVRLLEECVIQLLDTYGIAGSREEGFTGVWIKPKEIDRPKRKICAIGVHLSRWVTMHGFALNVNTDLSYFKNIVPCGIKDDDKIVTSMESELGRKVDQEEVKMRLKSIFAKVFEFEYIEEEEYER
ncbi:MAG: lipoyl(octanoyl) transferase [Saprospiraceae bacterium]|jgi:lipoyl(octanoyl) transferase|tara:strand:- start:376 stop:1116 length:741 start_codon:yes stop_codon:yes gene_type:complete